MSHLFLEAKGLTKFFGSFVANDQVSLKVEAGSIHGIVGENGAGKSTLMKMLYGMHQPESGELFVRGKKVSFRSPLDALTEGIGMVHQHFMLVSRMTALENLILGAEPSVCGILSSDSAKKDFMALAAEVGAGLTADADAGRLPVGQQQSLEILKLLYRKSECLIFDEPTGVLSPQEIDVFLKTLLDLKAKGKTILLISHKLNEILRVSDQITVMRGGKSVATLDAKTTTTTDLAHLMVGREVQAMDAVLPRKKMPPFAPILKASAVSAGSLKNLDFELSPGEILGVAGISGNGQRDLAEFLWGVSSVKAGTLNFKGRDISRHSVVERKQLGFSHIPEDRHLDGLVLDLSVRENFYLGNESFYQKPFLLPRQRLDVDLKKGAELLAIKFGGPKSAARELSGGNQQKVIVARELVSSPKFLIAAEPTRGVDIGAIERIHAELIRRRNEGLAILLISSELDELLALSDRLIVLRESKISARFDDLSGDWTLLRYRIGEAMICRS